MLESECEACREDVCTVVASKRQIGRDLRDVLKRVFDRVQRMELTGKWLEHGVDFPAGYPEGYSFSNG